MHYVIDQVLLLAFPDAVREHQYELRLMPEDGPTQRIAAASLTVDPESVLSSHLDYFGNRVHHGDITRPHDAMRATVHVEVETLLDNPFDYRALAPAAERAWLAATLKAQPRLWDYVLHDSVCTPGLAHLDGAREWPRYDPERPLLDSVHAAREWIAATLVYDPGAPRAALADVLAAGAGGAGDLAHLFITLVRSWQCAARYVRGYIDPATFDGDASAAALHAWAEVLIPGAGWRGVDPTTGLVVNDTYVAVAVGRDQDDVPLHRSACTGEEQGVVPEVSLRMSREAAQQ